jgi:hypothetical protein
MTRREDALALIDCATIVVRQTALESCASLSPFQTQLGASQLFINYLGKTLKTMSPFTRTFCAFSFDPASDQHLRLDEVSIL